MRQSGGRGHSATPFGFNPPPFGQVKGGWMWGRWRESACIRAAAPAVVVLFCWAGGRTWRDRRHGRRPRRFAACVRRGDLAGRQSWSQSAAAAERPSRWGHPRARAAAGGGLGGDCPLPFPLSRPASPLYQWQLVPLCSPAPLSDPALFSALQAGPHPPLPTLLPPWRRLRPPCSPPPS